MKILKDFKLFEAYTVVDGVLDVTHKNLTSLDELPKSVKILYCYDNKLTSLPELPNGLELLSCYKNELTSLPELPDELIALSCNINFLTSLPKLPKSMTHLYVSENSLTSLPELPKGLEKIYCHKNKLTSLPELPKGLKKLMCHGNPLKCLIPTKFVEDQSGKWLNEYYKPYIGSYEGQRNILEKQPNMAKQLEEQTKILLDNPVGILPEIKKEYEHLFTGSDLNLI